MADSNARKGSRFLEDLDEYYKAREKHTYSFSNVPCPQNFIPGATKAKAPSVKLLRNMSRKVSSVCYRGIVVRMKDNMTVAEKGLIPAGLLALGVPTPSQHTSCLEHELERIRQKKSVEFGISPGVHKSVHSLDEEILEDEDTMLLEVAKSKQRGCSLPMTSRDVSTLPVVSFDENVVAEFGRQEWTSTEIKRHSYPLSLEDYEAYKPRVHDMKPTHMRQIDSVARLGALCRGASYYGSAPGNTWRRTLPTMTNDGLSQPRWKRTGKKHAKNWSKEKSKGNDTGQSKALGDIQESGMPKFPWQEAAIKAQSNSNSKQKSGKEPQGSNDNKTKEENADSKKKGESQNDRKSLKERFTIKRNKSRKSKEEENEEISTEPDKQTLTQIQDALRSKLPRTMQTTVKMGLSFDPITVRERSNTARDCSTLTAMLADRSRSMSTPGTPERLGREERSQTLGNIFTTPSFMLSPPDEEEIEPEDKTTLFDSLIKLGKDTLSRSAEKVALAIRKEALKVPSATDVNLMKKDLSDLSLTDVHIKKLQSLLGPEFNDIYAKQRSNSLPLMRKKRIPIVKKVPVNTRSASEISGDHIFIPTVNFSHLWSSGENSDTSGSRTSKGESTENELSDYELLDEDAHGKVRPDGKTQQNKVDDNSNNKFRSVKLVYLSNKNAQQNSTGTKNTELNGEGPLGLERDAMKIKRCYSVPAESPANSDINSSSSANRPGMEKFRPKLSPNNSLQESISENDNAKHGVYHSKNKQHNKFATLPARKPHNGSHSFDTKNVRYIRAFQQSAGVQRQTYFGANNGSESGHSNGICSLGMRPEVVSLKSSIVLKSTKELIEDFKGSQSDGIHLGGTNAETENQEEESKDSEHDTALAELDALLQEFEEYNNC